LKAILLAACMAASFPAWGQARPDYTLLGAGVRGKPDFLGSNDRKVELVPVVRYYGGPWFVRTTHGVFEGGARAALGGGFEAGAQLAFEEGPRDDDPGVSGGVHARWEGNLGPAPVSLLARARQHLNTDRGMQVDTRATVGVFAGGGFGLAVFGEATWANAKSTQAHYGLSESGLLYTVLGLQGGYEISRHWLAVGNLERRALSGDVARSAIVQRRSATYVSAGLAYRF
jgi:outer membrane scaffolding protein for murein synthesis (MipA/OmpV family)